MIQPVTEVKVGLDYPGNLSMKLSDRQRMLWTNGNIYPKIIKWQKKILNG